MDGCLVSDSPVSHITQPHSVQFRTQYRKQIQFLVPPTVHTSVFLGLPWLKKDNPVVEWIAARTVSWSASCEQNCKDNSITINMISNESHIQAHIPMSISSEYFALYLQRYLVEILLDFPLIGCGIALLTCCWEHLCAGPRWGHEQCLSACTTAESHRFQTRRRRLLQYLMAWEGYSPEEHGRVLAKNVLSQELGEEVHVGQPAHPATCDQGRPPRSSAWQVHCSHLTA